MILPRPLPLPPSRTKNVALVQALLGLTAIAFPSCAFAASGSGTVFGTILQLPLMLALAVGAHVVIGRVAKWLAGAISPLATGEEEAVRYQRDVYGTAEREVLEICGVVIGAGVLLWLGATVAPRWLVAFGVVLLIAGIVLDLLRWERATASANFVWFQRGLMRKVHQIAIENIRDLAVQEEEVRFFTLRHGMNNRICRVHLRMNDKRIVSLPRTDANRSLDDVETLANHVRARLQIMDEHHKIDRAARDSDLAPLAPARSMTPEEREMRHELKMLRKKALAPDLTTNEAKPVESKRGH
jgi:hypothetical protein